MSKAKENKINYSRVKTPTILQMEAVECGAAALAIILGYHGRYVPLEKLRVECGVSRDGLKATNLMKAARAYGLKAKGYAKSVEKLQMMKMPVIIFWNFNHFLVLEGFSKSKVYLSDPAQGRYTVDYEEFNESFTGVVIELEPGEDFVAKNEKKSLASALRKRISGSRIGLTFIVLVSLFLVIPGLVVPSLTQIFVDNYLINGRANYVMPLILVMGLLIVINATLTFLQQFYLLRLETKLALTTSSKFLWHVLHLPMGFFNQRFAGEVSSRVSLNDKVARMLSGDLANSVLNVVVIVFYAALMFTYDVLLSWICVAVGLLNVIALQAVSKARKDCNRTLINENGKLVGSTISGISMIETLKACGREGDFYSNWSGYLAKLINAQQHLAWLSIRLNTIPPLLMSLNTTAVMTIGALRVMDGHMTIGMLMAFLYLMNNFLRPINQLVAMGSKLQEAEGDMGRIDDVLNYEASQDLLEANTQAPAQYTKGATKLQGSLALNDVTFGYSKSLPPLIENFSLNIQPGRRVALVGGSGSGKSTVARLVSGLYDPWKGDILYDGKQRSDIPRDVMNNSMAVVDQDIIMFEGSINENLTFWDHSLEDAMLTRAAEDAMIHDVISARVGGYQSVVAERGANFSGGQRQRIEIARALAISPSLLVLDEATSALDPKTEKEIMDNVRRRGCTCLIIAHRLSTIRDCDEIIVMKSGKIAERGTHDYLLSLNGVYTNLIKSN